MPALYPSNIESPLAARIYIGSAPGAEIRDDTLWPRSVVRRLGPGQSAATIELPYGKISTGGPFRTVAPRALTGQYIRIALYDTDAGTETDVFSGIIRRQATSPEGTFQDIAGPVGAGTITYEAAGPESDLDRIIIDTTTTLSYSDLPAALPFGRNRSAAKTGGRYLFDFADSATQWTVRDILEYLLVRANADSAWTWSLTGLDASLTMPANLDPNGKSIRRIVNELVRASDGFAWYAEAAGANCELRIVSLSDVNVLDLDGAIAVPANPHTVTIHNQIEHSRDLRACTITRIADSAYSQIEVRGEPILVIGTLKAAATGSADGLVPDWDASAESAFQTATDTQRQDDQYEPVYARLKLPDTWNGKDFQGVNIIPSYDPDTAQLDYTTPGPYAPPALVFERRFPVEDIAKTAKPALPLLLDSDGNRFVPNRANPDLPAVGLDLVDDAPAVQLRAGSNVLLGKNHFTGQSAYEAVYDWLDTWITLAFYIFRPVSVRAAGSGTSGRKVIRAPGYHLWVCPNPAALKDRGQTFGSRVLRDDRPALKKLAAMYATWYGRERNPINLTADVIPSAPRLGKIVTQVYTGGSYTPIRTIVSSETYSFDAAGRLGYAMSTDYADLDFARITRRRVLAGERGLRNRLNRIRDFATAVPLRVAPGGPGGSTLVPVEITGIHPDSPGAGNTRVFIGNVYAGAGAYNDPATATGVTIIVNYLAADVDITGARALAVKCPGAAWTGASSPHTETVYRMDVPGVMVEYIPV